MNLNAKVALSLILGASTLLSACDNKENISTQVEKAVRIPAPTEKAESAVEKSKELVAETQSAEKAEKTESADVKADAKKADEKSDAVKAEVKKETKETKADGVAEKVSEKKETVVAQQATTPQKPRVVVTEKAAKESAERKQQRSVLNVLEKQYEQVRCSADAKNLSADSFCRQEERRLFLEIQRIKDELRGIAE
jgi:DNA polymerase III gamma/tau subunit